MQKEQEYNGNVTTHLFHFHVDQLHRKHPWPALQTDDWTTSQTLQTSTNVSAV